MTIAKIVFRTALCLIISARAMSALAAAEPVIIDDSLTMKKLGRNYEYLEDSAGNFTIKMLTSRATAGRYHWRQANQDVFNKGYNKSVWWLRFVVENRSESEREIYLNAFYPLMGRLYLYLPEGEGDYREIQTGNKFPFHQRPIEHRTFVFPLNVPADGGMTLYLRVQSEGTINVPLALFSPAAFNKATITENIFLFMFYGIMFIMALYNLIIFFASRDWSYLYYVLYIVFFGMVAMSINGQAYQYLWPNSPWWGDQHRPIIICGLIVSIAQFGRQFVKTQACYHIGDIILRVIICAALVLAAFVLPVNNYRLTVSASVYLAIATILYSLVFFTVILVRKRSRQAAYFLGSFVFFFTGALAYLLKSAGLLQESLFTNYSIQMGAVAQITLLSLGLADRINQMRKELLVLNTGLEEKVRERTGELNAANEELSAMNEHLVEARDALWGEMQLAKKIQMALLPITPAMSGYEVAAYMKPADEVGGDYYDVINVGGIDWIVIGDVSGHGVPAGLIMMMVQTSIHSVLACQPNLKPSKLLAQVNKVITSNIRKLSEDKYMTITVFACIKNGKFYYSGLHLDIMVYRCDTDQLEIITTEGAWLGILDAIKDVLTDKTFILNSGDAVLTYTDGITEAWLRGSVKDIRDPSNQMFGDERLAGIFKELGKRKPAEVIQGIIDSLDNYIPSDDVTLMVIKRL